MDRGIRPNEERWFVEIDLRDVRGARLDTRFVLEVYSEEWGFHLHHLARSSWIRVTDVAFVHGRDDHELLAHLPRLREIGLFVREIERRYAIRFDREAAKIRTSIPNAEPVLRDWVAAI